MCVAAASQGLGSLSQTVQSYILILCLVYRIISLSLNVCFQTLTMTLSTLRAFENNYFYTRYKPRCLVVLLLLLSGNMEPNPAADRGSIIHNTPDHWVWV